MSNNEEKVWKMARGFCELLPIISGDFLIDALINEFVETIMVLEWDFDSIDVFAMEKVSTVQTSQAGKTEEKLNLEIKSAVEQSKKWVSGYKLNKN